MRLNQIYFSIPVVFMGRRDAAQSAPREFNAESLRCCCDELPSRLLTFAAVPYGQNRHIAALQLPRVM